MANFAQNILNNVKSLFWHFNTNIVKSAITFDLYF